MSSLCTLRLRRQRTRCIRDSLGTMYGDATAKAATNSAPQTFDTKYGDDIAKAASDSSPHPVDS